MVVKCCYNNNSKGESAIIQDIIDGISDLIMYAMYDKAGKYL